MVVEASSGINSHTAGALWDALLASVGAPAVKCSESLSRFCRACLSSLSRWCRRSRTDGRGGGGEREEVRGVKFPCVTAVCRMPLHYTTLRTTTTLTYVHRGRLRQHSTHYTHLHHLLLLLLLPLLLRDGERRRRARGASERASETSDAMSQQQRQRRRRRRLLQLLLQWRRQREGARRGRRPHRPTTTTSTTNERKIQVIKMADIHQ